MRVVQVGYKRPLQKEDLWRYDDSRRTRYVADKLMANIEKRRKSNKSSHILLFALNDTFFRQFWMAGLLKVFSFILSPLTLVAWGLYQCDLTARPEVADFICQPSLPRKFNWCTRTRYRSWHWSSSWSSRDANSSKYMSTSLFLSKYDDRRNGSISSRQRHLPEITPPFKQSIFLSRDY